MPYSLKPLRSDGVDAALSAAAREGHRLEAVSHYNCLLERENLADFASNLEAEMRNRGALFGDRLMCPFLRPHFCGREQLDLLRTAVRGVVGACNVLGPRIAASSELQDMLGLSEDERRFCAVDPGYPEFSVTSRLDSFLLGGKVRFVEWNAETPAGIGYNDVMQDAFLATDLMRKFMRDFPFQPFYTSERLLKALIDCYKTWGGKEEPVIGIIDYEGLPTRHEFEIFRRFFTSHGYKCVVADPRKLDYNGERLSFEGQTINLVYRRLLTTEFLEHYEAAKPMWEAYRDGKICMVNNFRAKYFHKKAIFALITDPKFQEGMSAEQLFAVYTHVPWTRTVADVKSTDIEGKAVDLLDFIRTNRHQLVMKPNDEYGGKGIFVGWELDESGWDEAIQSSLQSHYLVQTRVEVSREVYPTWDGHAVEWGEYTVDLDPYVFSGEVEGMLTRLSATALCNVTAGGGVVPTFVLD